MVYANKYLLNNKINIILFQNLTKNSKQIITIVTDTLNFQFL